MFQLIIPGIDEEIMYRGILLGILMNCINQKYALSNYFSILIIAILFGLVHALRFTVNFSIGFNIFNFISISIIGYILGWITIKNKSIVLPILVHNMSNFFGVLATMLKE